MRSSDIRTCGIFVILIGVSSIIYQYILVHQIGKESLNLPEISSILETLPEHHIKAMKYGTYRSGHYFGLRSKTEPYHISAGLAWMGKENEGERKIRHECSQEDGLEQYGWKQHDGKSFGYQEIVDQHVEARLDTYFLNQNENSWRARISTRKYRPTTSSGFIDLFFYMDYGCYDDNLSHPCRQYLGSWSVVEKTPTHILLQGTRIDTDAEKLWVRIWLRRGLGSIDYTGVQDSNVLNVTTYLGDLARTSTGRVELNGDIPAKASLVILHARVPKDNGGIDIAFGLGDFNKDSVKSQSSQLDKDIVEASNSFNQEFSDKFQLHGKEFLGQPLNESMMNFAQSALSNLVGGIGYFYGSSVVGSNRASLEGALLSAVPSRSFFPRGFLWDEGFHQLLISQWDPEISKEVIVHWMGRMYKDDRLGWIAREQILGEEAKQRVPEEFLVQYSKHANPPTLLLAVETLMKDDLFEGNRTFFEKLFPYLHAWYKWYKTTQAGYKEGTFRWRGRSSTDGKTIANTLSSGLDDFPRASKPSSAEKHVDLLCWMISSAQLLKTIAKLINLPEESVQEYADDEKLWLSSLDTHHWNSKTNIYADFGEHSNDGKLVEYAVVRCQSSNRKTVDVTMSLQERVNPCPPDHPQFLFPLGDGHGGILKKFVFIPGKTKRQFVDHIGYVNCFPLILKLLPPDSPKLKRLLDIMSDPKHLWTDFGLRSMSTQDQLYEIGNGPGDHPYWRGPIWMNINYMAVGAFHHYSSVKGPYQDDFRVQYGLLRNNLISTVYNEYTRTGYLWEQYNGDIRSPGAGRGQKSHPFTGWTTLIVKILTESY